MAMSLDEFHSMVTDAMNLQRSLAKSDEREEDSVSDWHNEFADILKGAVEEEN